MAFHCGLKKNILIPKVLLLTLGLLEDGVGNNSCIVIRHKSMFSCLGAMFYMLPNHISELITPAFQEAHLPGSYSLFSIVLLKVSIFLSIP